MASFFDNYSRNARLLPAFICAIPASITFAAFGSSVSAAIATVIGGASALGLTALLAQLGRDRGKSKEAGLFTIWGGKPSVAKLRHRNNSINPHTKSRYISKARGLLPEIAWPTSDEERTDPIGSDQKYEALSNFLLERTRDSKKYPLVYAELVNYGFRRNLWGLKPIGITCVVICCIALLLQSSYGLHRHVTTPPLTLVVASADIIVLLIWSFWITPNWVRIAADAYAERLLSSLELI